MKPEAPYIPDPNCTKCEGSGWYAYDHNHGTVCDACCPHNAGWWLLRDGYSFAGELACNICGIVRKDMDSPPRPETKARKYEAPL